MFKSVVMAALMLSSAYVSAQELFITGTVKDAKSMQALGGASVQLVQSGKFTVADENGRFQIENLRSGEYTILVSFLGYQNKTQKVVLTESTEVTVLMEEGVQFTEEVVVSATRANEKTPTAFVNVNRKEIQDQNFGQDMPYLLNWTPSVVTTSDAGAGIGYTGLRIRGSDATRINVTINGIPYNDSESQGTFWVDIPDIASSTQSVQIQRGVGTSSNGAGSFGGSVNVQTLSQRRDPYAEAMLGIGSFNTQRFTASAGTGLIKNHWTFDARASKITSDGYIDRAASDLVSYYFSGGYYGAKTIVKAIYFGGHENTYQSWNGVDEATLKTDRTFNSAGALYNGLWEVIGYYDNEVDDYRQDHYQLHLTQQIDTYWNANVSLHYTYGRGYYEQYKQQKPFAELGLDDIVIGGETIATADFIIRKWLDNKFYGTTFSLNYEKEKTSLTIGGAYNRYGNAKHFGEIIWGQYASNSKIRQHYYEGESQKDDFNIYGKLNYAFSPAWNVFADLQFRKIDYQTQGTDDDLNDYDVSDSFNFFNPKLGLSYTTQSNDVLYASWAVANREPNRTDYLDGDVKPKAETLQDLELGWRKSSTQYNLEVNLYYMNYKDQLVLTGELNNVGNPIRANVGSSYRTGVEISGGVKLGSKFFLNANVTGSINKNKDYIVDENNLADTRNTNIILSPNWIGGSQLTWNAFKGFQAVWMTKLVGEQYLDNTETKSLKLGSYVLNDVRFNYTYVFKTREEIGFSLLVNNLFDVEYSSNGYAYDGAPYYYPQAGTNFMAMMTLKF
ncbi:MAG TPA: TonB-dependent receptor [Ohtaekwangia sp.]